MYTALGFYISPINREQERKEMGPASFPSLGVVSANDSFNFAMSVIAPSEIGGKISPAVLFVVSFG